MAWTCTRCGSEQMRSAATLCDSCGASRLTDEQRMEFEAERETEFVRMAAITLSTLPPPAAVDGLEELGLVFGASSKQAWGLNSQADRLTQAYEAAAANLRIEAVRRGADAVYGVTFALNNSTGSNAELLAGGSEAVMLLGTAVRRRAASPPA